VTAAYYNEIDPFAAAWLRRRGYIGRGSIVLARKEHVTTGVENV
jgi:hypothetical protein